MKISPISYLIVGLAVGLIAFFYGFFDQWIPNMNDVDAYQKNTALQNAEGAKQKSAEKRVAQAIATVKQKDAIWQAVVATRTPPDNVGRGGIYLDEDAYHLGIDTYTFRDNIQRAVNKQLRMGGVKVLSAPTIPMLDPNVEVNSILTSFYNYPAIPFPVVIFDFGTITVQGTYAQIMNHLRSFKKMPNYLAVTDGLTLTGTSPELTASYNLSMVGFIRAKHVFVPVAEQGAAAAGGRAGAGGFGGFGAPGGPPIGPGGPIGRGGPPPGFGGGNLPPGGFGAQSAPTGALPSGGRPGPGGD